MLRSDDAFACCRHNAADAKEAEIGNAQIGLSRLRLVMHSWGARLGRGCIFGFEKQMTLVAFLRTGFLESQRRSRCATESAAMEGT
jgi:hypothetical protein